MNILIIEDDIRYTELLLHRLGKRFSFTIAKSMTEGIEQLKNNKYHAVLLDVILPDSTKEATLDEIKKHRHGAAVVILTGYNEPRFREHMLLKNADGYACKDKDDNAEDLEWIINRAVECRQRINLLDNSLKRLEERI